MITSYKPLNFECAGRKFTVQASLEWVVRGYEDSNPNPINCAAVSLDYMNDHEKQSAGPDIVATYMQELKSMIKNRVENSK